ncbi:MAG: murein biosynthesis integral membrane protein MurJ [Clostridia bacterium]|nr:murein biosynthesis integral membrane protein MurJ [Clostridia bacterium]
MKKDSSAKTVRTIGFMAVIIFCAKFMGLLREVLIAGVYGQGYASDVLNTSTQIPLLFFDMTLGVAILSTFVPVFNKCLEREGRPRAIEFANNFMTVVTLLATIFAVLGMVFAEPVVGFMVPGYGEEKIAETAKLLRVLFPSIIFTAAAYTSVGILQSFGEFNIPSIISVVSNLIMILYLIVFGNRFGLLGVIVSMLIAWAAQLFVQMPHLKKFGYAFRFKLNLRDNGLVSAAKLAVPVLISSWVQPLCVVINMAFGSGFGDGAVSGLNWANKIYIIMVGVFAYAVTNFIFPKLARLDAGRDSGQFGNVTRTSVGWTVCIIAYVSAMFMVLCQPIIKLVFERGEFTSEDTILCANALFHYSVGMIGYAICEILNKSFYAIEDGKTPMFTSMLGVAVNFASAFVFVRVANMGVGGLALASATSSIVMALVLLLMMNKRRPGTFERGFWLNLSKIVVGGLLSAVVAGVIYSKLGKFSDGMLWVFIKLCISAIPALVVYIGISGVLNTEEFKQVRRFLCEK